MMIFSHWSRSKRTQENWSYRDCCSDITTCATDLAVSGRLEIIQPAKAGWSQESQVIAPEDTFLRFEFGIVSVCDGNVWSIIAFIIMYLYIKFIYATHITELSNEFLQTQRWPASLAFLDAFGSAAWSYSILCLHLKPTVNRKQVWQHPGETSRFLMYSLKLLDQQVGTQEVQIKLFKSQSQTFDHCTSHNQLYFWLLKH